eukprot:CAMPEP_0206148648 /NCGR_PEP_ID=MMETSP1473-20131121/37276_1 /ASSEMBLY_ACC=CAM_ASM_001109 /TAXON_ID=1461547 /ORGANISM="Stichococcus sp, Strain RCC1054" /LENGTH=52 /DNA_ID=CAMNT_0053546059 /DNA_START=389 /DNA_END=545 /DNA_ORIENTATION=-
MTIAETPASQTDAAAAGSEDGSCAAIAPTSIWDAARKKSPPGGGPPTKRRHS